MKYLVTLTALYIMLNSGIRMKPSIIWRGYYNAGRFGLHTFAQTRGSIRCAMILVFLIW